jgi:hypothetical protein
MRYDGLPRQARDEHILIQPKQSGHVFAPVGESFGASSRPAGCTYPPTAAAADPLAKEGAASQRNVLVSSLPCGRRVCVLLDEYSFLSCLGLGPVLAN